MKKKELMNFLAKCQDKEIEIVCISQYRDGWKLKEDKQIFHPNGIGEFEDTIIIQAIRKEGIKRRKK